MPRETGSGNESVFNADKSALINSPEELAPERKDQYLKRLKAEEEEAKKGRVVVDEYIEIVGKKVLRKVSKKNGNGYTFYWFNNKRYPKEYKQLLARGGFDRKDENGETKFVPLKYIDGRPFVKKGK